MATYLPGNLVSKLRKQVSVHIFRCAIVSIIGNQTTMTKLRKLLLNFCLFFYLPTLSLKFSCILHKGV